MGKQLGPNYKEMCKQNLQFYKMDGQYYVRKKSSLSRRRVLKDKAFTLTMVHANIMAQASPIASAVYRQIPKEDKDFSYFRVLVGKAQSMIKLGMNREEIYKELYQMTFPPAPVMELVRVGTEKTTVNCPSYADAVLNSIFSVKLNIKKAYSSLLLESLPP